jgi:hypothetical protein
VGGGKASDAESSTIDLALVTASSTGLRLRLSARSVQHPANLALGSGSSGRIGSVYLASITGCARVREPTPDPLYRW